MRILLKILKNLNLIEIKSGQADIGFVAYEATRLGIVEFSETYMLVQQSFLVRGDSPMRAVADIDRAGQKIGGTRNDSMMLCLKRVLKQATPVELDNNSEQLIKALVERHDSVSDDDWGVDVDVPRLPDPVGAVGGLVFLCRIPVAHVVDHVVGLLDVEPDARGDR